MSPSPLDGAFRSFWELDSRLIAKLGRLEWLSKLVIEGMGSGLHRSPFSGASVEFAGHRSYGPGDEIRKIDWRAYGKHERFYVKEQEDETNIRVYLIVDASGSMVYASSQSEPSKLDLVKVLAATFARLFLKQRDSVGLITSAQSANPIMTPPRSTPSQLSAICSALDQIAPSGPCSWSQSLEPLAQRSARRGLVVLLTDGFAPLQEWRSAFQALKHRRHRWLMVRVLASDELHFNLNSDQIVQFQDLEQLHSSVRAHPQAIRSSYLDRFHQYSQDLEELVMQYGGAFRQGITHEHPSTIMRRTLQGGGSF